MRNVDTLQQCNTDDDRHKVVRRRWRLLAEALFANSNGDNSCSRDDGRNACQNVVPHDLNFFELFSVYPQPQQLNDRNASWYRYELKVDGGGSGKSVQIRRPSTGVTVDRLAGFNNTGNVRIWPSEEVLAYLVAKNVPFFADKCVLEVGGGMSCLAGVFLAQHGRCSRVQLTDGNANAVENVAKILEANAPTGAAAFGCEMLVWSEHRLHARTYDVVLSADCLFFDECRVDLVLLLEALLRPDGVALMVAPRRGDSLRKFVCCARDRGFRCLVRSRYDQTVWSRHSQLMAQQQMQLKAQQQMQLYYDENVHFPLLVVVTRASNATETHGLWQV